MTVCKKVLFSGQVQGVGFRYTALNLANNHQVAGTVRNCPDGQVELFVQGEPSEVQAFLETLASQMSGYISEQHVRDAQPLLADDFRIIR